MLSEEEQTRMRLEEEWRYNIREALKENKRAKDRWHKLERFANSNFGIFLCSTIVLGLLSWSYTRWDTARTVAAENRERLKRLDIEISFRISRAQRTKSIVALAKGENSKEVYDLLVKELNGSRSIFQEFDARPLFLLLDELYELIPTVERGSIGSLRRLSRSLVELEPIKIGAEKRVLNVEDKVARETFYDTFWPRLVDIQRWSPR